MNYNDYNFVDEIMNAELCLYNDYMTYINDDGTVEIDMDAEDYEVCADYDTIYDYFDNHKGYEIVTDDEPHETGNDCYDWVASITVKKLGDD